MRTSTNTLLAILALASATLLTKAEENWGPDTVHVVHFGDSVTETQYLPAEKKIESLLQALLRKAYGSEKVFCHNVSKGGSTVQSFMAASGKHAMYAEKCLPFIKKIDLCFIMFGANDEDKFTPDEFKANLAGMCDSILKDYPGAKIVLCTSVATKDRDWWKNAGRDAEEPISRKHYAKTRELAREKNYPLVDFYARMVEEMNKGNWDLRIRNQVLARKHYGQLILDDSKDAERKADGTLWFKDDHPNARGVELIANLELETLRKAFPEKLPAEVQLRK
jgi:lysophospholipase L1-like esterase